MRPSSAPPAAPDEETGGYGRTAPSLSLPPCLSLHDFPPPQRAAYRAPPGGAAGDPPHLSLTERPHRPRGWRRYLRSLREAGAPPAGPGGGRHPRGLPAAPGPARRERSTKWRRRPGRLGTPPSCWPRPSPAGVTGRGWRPLWLWGRLGGSCLARLDPARLGAGGRVPPRHPGPFPWAASGTAFRALKGSACFGFYS